MTGGDAVPATGRTSISAVHRWGVAVAFVLGVSAIPLEAQGPGAQGPGAQGPEAQSPAAQSIAEEVNWRVEHLRVTGALQVADEMVPRLDLTLEVYEQRDFLPLWTERAAVESLLLAIAGSWDDGLDPEDYHLSALTDLTVRGVREASSAAELDLLATDALVRLGHDLRFGKVKPQGPTNQATATWTSGGPDAVANLADVVASGRIREALVALRPGHFVYRGLMDALADLRGIRSAGGWETLPAGPTLRRDDVDARVPLLRRRLALEGDLEASVDEADLRFDAALEAAVRSFQHRHGLNEDGVVGNATLAASNVPVDRRIEQVRVNLERTRWVAHELPDTFVAANVAGAKVYLLHGDHVAFETRAIVGTGYTKTPVFTAPMLYIQLNPTWTVPPGIVHEILGNVKRDPGYLNSQGMRVLDRSGHAVDPSEIDFSRFTATNFPYVFRQDPGPKNALGKIKLMLPNQYSVYLHDTPARTLFAQEQRLLSHGCIRLEDPLGLAELVLGDALRWNRATLQAAIDKGITQTISLADPVPVFVLYWTAAVDLQGELHLYPDVYDRDAAVLAGLDARLDSRPAHGTPAGESR